MGLKPFAALALARQAGLQARVFHAAVLAYARGPARGWVSLLCREGPCLGVLAGFPGAQGSLGAVRGAQTLAQSASHLHTTISITYEIRIQVETGGWT